MHRTHFATCLAVGFAAILGCSTAPEDDVGQQDDYATSSSANQAALATLKNHRIKNLWHCKKGWGQEAVVMFEVDGSVSQMFSGREILAVQDPDICRALAVTCPYVASAHSPSSLTPHSQHSYASSRGRYEDGVLFFSDGAGMKLVLLENGRGVYPHWDRNWYFHEGECIKD